jgi:hypothetical protein
MATVAQRERQPIIDTMQASLRAIAGFVCKEHGCGRSSDDQYHRLQAVVAAICGRLCPPIWFGP